MVYGKLKRTSAIFINSPTYWIAAILNNFIRRINNRPPVIIKITMRKALSLLDHNWLPLFHQPESDFFVLIFYTN